MAEPDSTTLTSIALTTREQTIAERALVVLASLMDHKDEPERLLQIARAAVDCPAVTQKECMMLWERFAPDTVGS